MDDTESASDMSERRWLWRLAATFLIVGSAVLRIVYLANNCPLDLAPDEAHYWDWSRHLDWSYYSKGPLIALVIRASCEVFGGLSRALTGTELLAVRLPAVICGALLLTSLYVLTVQVHRRERWALAVVAIALTLPLISAGSSLMTIDAPFTCAWGWALVAAHRAIFRGSFWAWPAAGLCILIGVLAKHTMVLWVPCLALFLLLSPPHRPTLWSGRFWLMTAIGALGGVPILIWNMQHGWVTLLHTQQSHAGLSPDDRFSWIGPVRYLGTQFLVLLGFWFLVWVRAVWTYRPGRESRPEIGYLWWMSVPMIVFFGLFSLRNGGGEPNWPITGYIAGMVLAIGWLAEEWTRARAWYRASINVAITMTATVGLFISLAVHDTAVLAPVLLRMSGQPTAENPWPLRRFDPTCRLRGWHFLGAEVDAEHARLRAAGDDPVLACGIWSLPGEIGFYCKDQPTVYSIGRPMGDRHSQYDLWHPNPISEPEQFRGKTFLIVGVISEQLMPGFDEVEPTRFLTYSEHGQPIAVWTITVARGYRGFPTGTASPAY